VSLGGKLFELDSGRELAKTGMFCCGVCGDAVYGIRSGLAVVDRVSPRSRFERFDFPDGSALVVLPELWVRGDAAALDATVLLVDGEPCPLIERATELYSPRRVAAALHGIAVEDPILERRVR
jgi:hypothetical protein